MALFAADQIRADDERRYGFHWNTRTGRFALKLDREGAILHDIGWDHLEGGRIGKQGWLSAHWPDLTSVFVLGRRSGLQSDLDLSVSSAHCPGCGAAESDSTSSACEFCGTVLSDGSHDWALLEVHSDISRGAQKLKNEIGGQTA